LRAGIAAMYIMKSRDNHSLGYNLPDTIQINRH